MHCITATSFTTFTLPSHGCAFNHPRLSAINSFLNSCINHFTLCFKTKTPFSKIITLVLHGMTLIVKRTPLFLKKMPLIVKRMPLIHSGVPLIAKRMPLIHPGMPLIAKRVPLIHSLITLIQKSNFLMNIIPTI